MLGKCFKFGNSIGNENKILQVKLGDQNNGVLKGSPH